MKPARVAAGAVVLSVLAGGVGWFAGRAIESPADAAARAKAPKPSLISVPVERRTLSANLVVRGTVGAANSTEVTLPASAIGTKDSIVVTPPKLGATLNEGDLALVIADRPVFVLQGDLPMYRDLRPGMKGEDVRLLNASLARLGLLNGTVDDKFKSDTQDGLTKLYDKHGYAAVGRTAEEKTRIDQLNSQLAAARAANDAAGASRAQSDLDDALASTGVSAPANEIAFVNALPAVVQASKLQRGSRVDGPVMTLATTTSEVRASVARVDRPLVKPGMPAKVQADDVATSFNATVASIADQPGTDGAGEGRYAVTLAPEQLPPDSFGLSVKITVPVKSTEGEVLVVPAAALSVNADGDSRVRVVTNDSRNETREVVVTPGLQSNGLVEVTPARGSLAAGDRVVVGTGGAKTKSTT